jgi:hypothetical protein
VRIVEQPFLTREAILAVLRPGQITSERPFDNLRQKGAASQGTAVYLRLHQGRMAGSLHLYSALNGDAARAYRLRQFDIAKELARQGRKLERSRAAKRILGAIERVSSIAVADPFSEQAPDALRQYVRMRRSCWKTLDHSALIRDWLVQSNAWLSDESPDREALVDAVETLRLAAEKVRARVLDSDEVFATTFFGFVARLNAFSAELEGETGEVMHLSRKDLEREGLAVIGKPVALLQEALPGGGSHVFPMPAVAVEPPDFGEGPSPWGPEFADQGIFATLKLRKRDAAWIELELGRRPNVIAAAPVKVK